MMNHLYPTVAKLLAGSGPYHQVATFGFINPKMFLQGLCRLYVFTDFEP